MSIPLDALEILTHLNSMGYRNVTAEQLKEFMRDLKHLMKYEMKYCNIDYSEIKQPKPQKQQPAASSPSLEHFDKLHLTSTISSRAKSHKKKQPQPTELTDKMNKDSKNEDVAMQSKQRSCKQERKTSAVPKITPRSIDATSTQTENKENVVVSNDKCPSNQALSVDNGPTSSKHSIYSSNTHHRYIRNTPTDLYQYYQQNWDKFKKNTPGENSHSTIRQAIRKRMEHIQKPQPKPKVYLSMDGIDNHKIIKRI